MHRWPQRTHPQLTHTRSDQAWIGCSRNRKKAKWLKWHTHDLWPNQIEIHVWTIRLSGAEMERTRQLAIEKHTSEQRRVRERKEKNELCQMPWPAVQSFPSICRSMEHQLTIYVLHEHILTHTFTQPINPPTHAMVCVCMLMLIDRYCDFVIIKFRWKMSYACLASTLGRQVANVLVESSGQIIIHWTQKKSVYISEDDDWQR